MFLLSSNPIDLSCCKITSYLVNTFYVPYCRLCAFPILFNLNLMALGSQEVDEDRWGKELLFEELNIMGFVHIIN